MLGIYFFTQRGDYSEGLISGRKNGGWWREQSLRPGEARVISIRKQRDHPQVVSTDRHILQGALDLSDVSWDPATPTLSGSSRVVADDPSVISITTHGLAATKSGAEDGVGAVLSVSDLGLLRLTLLSEQTRDVR